MAKKKPRPSPKFKSKKSDLYDKGKYNYLKYWSGRNYEHAAEELAIKRFLKGKRFKKAADIGGGYGRLCLLLKDYASEVVLIEPSKKQLDIAREYLKGRKGIQKKKMSADRLTFDNNSVGLITMIRVMHHLPDPAKELKEIHRVLSKNGTFILEVANYAHARNRFKHMLRRKRLPNMPVDIRSAQNRRADEIDFVNHNPKTVIKQLEDSGFEVVRILSVSNLRSPKLKKIIPTPVMLSAEALMQGPFARVYFGPSVFFLLKKK